MLIAFEYNFVCMFCLFLCLFVCSFVFVFNHRKKRNSNTQTTQANQLAFDGPYNATVRAGQSTFAGVNDQDNIINGTNNHYNETFQPDAIPSDDTGIYHDIKDATNEHAYATVHPHGLSQEDENASEQLYEDTCKQGTGEINIDNDHKSEEGWADNDIYTSN